MSDREPPEAAERAGHRVGPTLAHAAVTMLIAGLDLGAVVLARTSVALGRLATWLMPEPATTPRPEPRAHPGLPPDRPHLVSVPPPEPDREAAPTPDAGPHRTGSRGTTSWEAVWVDTATPRPGGHSNA